MQKKTCDGQHDKDEGKKNRGRDLDQERWAKMKKLQRTGQRGRNETRTGSWDSEQWREVARVGETTQNKPHSYTPQGRGKN